MNENARRRQWVRGGNAEFAHDPELAKVLEDKILPTELPTVRGRLKKGAEVSDASHFLYKYIYGLQEKGVPAERIRFRKDLLLANMQRKDNPREIVPGSNTRNRTDAALQAEELNRANTESEFV
jgi:hypothetical protein